MKKEKGDHWVSKAQCEMKKNQIVNNRLGQVKHKQREKKKDGALPRCELSVKKNDVPKEGFPGEPTQQQNETKRTRIKGGKKRSGGFFFFSLLVMAGNTTVEHAVVPPFLVPPFAPSLFSSSIEHKRPCTACPPFLFVQGATKNRKHASKRLSRSRFDDPD
jgi:hypothetical protein